MTDVAEIRAHCPHEASTNPRSSPEFCGKCGVGIPPWYLTEAFAREFYSAVGAKAYTDQALERLRRGGHDYGWTDYLGRDNAGGGLEELIDALHYAIFDTCDLHAEEENGMSPDRAELARQQLYLGACKVAEGMAHFAAAQRIKRDPRSH